MRQSLGLDDLCAADETADGFADEQVALQVVRQTIGADDVVAGAGGEVVEHADRHAHAAHAALGVGHARDGPDRVEAGLAFVGRRQGAVLNRDGVIERSSFAAAADEPHFSVVILRDAPLAAVRPGRFANESARRPAETEGVVGAVDPVVEAPDEAVLLVFEVAVASGADAGVRHFAFVGDAVVVRVGEPEDVVRIGFVGEDDAILEWQHHARQNQLVGKYRSLVVDTVALRALEAQDSADAVVRAVAVGIEHVARELDHVHSAVAVELDDGRGVDVGIGRDQLHPIAGRQDKGLCLVGGASCAGPGPWGRSPRPHWDCRGRPVLGRPARGRREAAVSGRTPQVRQAVRSPLRTWSGAIGSDPGNMRPSCLLRRRW